MPTEPIRIPKSKMKSTTSQSSSGSSKQTPSPKKWSCENHPGCMWSCPCDCNNCVEYNKVNQITKTNNICYK